jgi:hypothetical protein
MTEDALVLSHLAHVKRIANNNTQSLRHILGERGLPDEVLEGDNLFFFRAEISNDLLDSHFTHMSERTLQNYASDAEHGVAFLRGHNWHELPLGYSITGAVEDTGRKRVVADFYTVPGMDDTDNLISRIKTGLVRDVSVGFHGGRAICDLCGQDFWDCRHFPGLKYEEKEGDTVKTQLATFTIDDARLSEVSGVFDGSTPQAMILKAQRAAKAGELTRSQVALLESQYRVALPATTRYAVPEIPKTKEREMEVDFAKVRTLLAVESDDKIEEGVTKLQQRLAELEPQAKDGLQYRDDLVNEALEEGVRAQGAEFDKAAYEDMLRKSPLTLVKRFRDDWKKVADKQLPAGRTTTDGENSEERRVERANVVPDAAYA